MPPNLLIPGKYGFTPDRYKTDMQTLEVWARQPIQKLIAGSGITLSPSSGLATDSKGNGPNPITISASGGGGGGGKPTSMGFYAAPDAALQFHMQPLSLYSDFTNNVVFLPFWDVGSSDNPYAITYGMGWLYNQNIGVPNSSVNILPELNATGITFTGAGINAWGSYGASSIDGSNQLLYKWGPVAVPSGAVYQLHTTDLSNLITTGADLSLHAGSGLTGNGILTASGNISYFCGVSFTFEVLNPTTF